MIIVTQNKTKRINSKDIASIGIKKITNFDLTQEPTLKEENVGEYLIIMDYKKKKKIGGITVIVVDALGVYSTKKRAREVLEKLRLTEDIFEMPEV